MVFSLWLACHTEAEIAEKVGLTQRGAGKVLELNESFRLVLKPGLFAEIEDDEVSSKSANLPESVKQVN